MMKIISLGFSAAMLVALSQPVMADTYTQANFSGGVFPGDANVVSPFTSVVSQGQALSGSFVFDDALVPASGTGFVNVLTSDFPDVANIPASSLFTFNLGSLVLTAADVESGSTLSVQYNDGVFHGFAGPIDFLYSGSSYQLDLQGTVFTVRQLVNGVPDFSVNYVSGYLNSALTDEVPFTPVIPIGGTVPEPATWALVVGGLSMVGVANRRRRRFLAYS